MKQAPLPQKKILITSNNNNKYSVEIFDESNSLNIFIKTIDKIPSISYNNKFSLEDIKQLNKYFLSCSNISEVNTLLEPFIQNTDNLRLIEETNEINLIINISFPSPQIIFKIKSYTKNMNESINELYEIINKQNLQLNEQNDKINKQNDKINKQNIQLNEQNNIINKQNIKLNELRNEIKKKPIGIIEKEKKIFAVYSYEQIKENNKCW